MYFLILQNRTTIQYHIYTRRQMLCSSPPLERVSKTPGQFKINIINSSASMLSPSDSPEFQYERLTLLKDNTGHSNTPIRMQT